MTINEREQELGKSPQAMSAHKREGTTNLQLALAWGFVGIPLIWGVLQTLSNAMKLFQE